MVLLQPKFLCRNNNNKFKSTDELMLVILNCILLHNQNDGWTLPEPYFRVCCKNIYLLILFKKIHHCLINFMILEHFYESNSHSLHQVSFKFLPPKNWPASKSMVINP